LAMMSLPLLVLHLFDHVKRGLVLHIKLD